MYEFEYALFTTEDPIEKLKSVAKKLPMHKKFKLAPHVRRAAALTKQAKKSRDIITDDKSVTCMLIGLSFASYFGEKLDKDRYMLIPRDITDDYLIYLINSPEKRDDKYMKQVTNLIQANRKGIDSFVKAFLSIRVAQGELDKLQSAWNEIIF